MILKSVNGMVPKHFLMFSTLSLVDVLSEEAVLKWYTEAHLAKGKSVFLEQMKKFVEWLKNAEEGEYWSLLNMVVSLLFPY